MKASDSLLKMNPWLRQVKSGEGGQGDILAKKNSFEALQLAACSTSRDIRDFVISQYYDPQIKCMTELDL